MNSYTTSTGHSFSTSEWLDLHFDAVLPEYKSMIEQVGFKKDWRVLDAGSGNGRFIELIEEQVGARGQICALDLAPENIVLVRQKIAAKAFFCQVSAEVGSVVSLPFAENSFDAIWCAAVTQYLTKDELERTFREFKRVVKPGGLIAIKEFDGISSFYHPTPDLTLLWRSIDPMDAFDKKRWLLHPLEMHGLLKKVGLQDVVQKTFLVERRQPLRVIERRYIEGLIRLGQVSWTSLASLSKKDQVEWKALLSKTSSEYLLKRPNFYWREGHILALGKVL